MPFSKKVQNIARIILQKYHADEVEDPEEVLLNEGIFVFYIENIDEVDSLLSFLEKNKLSEGLEWGFDEEGKLLFIREKITF